MRCGPCSYLKGIKAKVCSARLQYQSWRSDTLILSTYRHLLGMSRPLEIARRRYQDLVFVWDKKFATRREEAYHAESNKVEAEDQQSMITAFLDQFATRLDPPQYSYAALRNFLEDADEDQLKIDPTPIEHRQVIVLVDDRRDNTGWKDIYTNWHRARDWNSYAEDGCPPVGEDVVRRRMNAGEFYRAQIPSVSRFWIVIW